MQASERAEPNEDYEETLNQFWINDFYYSYLVFIDNLM